MIIRFRALRLVGSSASASDSDNLVFTGSQATESERNRKKWKRSDSSDSDSDELMTAYDADFRFSLGHKLSHDSDYHSDSDASENQPLGPVYKQVGSLSRGFKVPTFTSEMFQVGLPCYLGLNSGRSVSSTSTK